MPRIICYRHARTKDMVEKTFSPHFLDIIAQRATNPREILSRLKFKQIGADKYTYHYSPSREYMEYVAKFKRKSNTFA